MDELGEARMVAIHRELLDMAAIENSINNDIPTVFALRFLMLTMENRIYTYETHALQMQPEEALKSNFDALQQHYQSRRPARDEMVVGMVRIKDVPFKVPAAFSCTTDGCSSVNFHVLKQESVGGVARPSRALCDDCSQDTTPGLTPVLNLKIERRGSSKDMVYATVVGQNVETLVGIDVISTYLNNSRQAMWDLQKLKLFGSCNIENGILAGFLPADD